MIGDALNTEATHMQSMIATKGRTTIPKPIRDHLQLKPGDRIKLFHNPAGSVAFLPTRPVTALKGMLTSRRGLVSAKEMNARITSGATARYRRFLTQ